MNFNKHTKLEGLHAFLSPSKYHWLRYDEDRFEEVYMNHKAKLLGTRKHDLAHELIQLGQKLPRSSKTLNLYVNDAIGFKMKSEVTLFYSFNCFGTADTIKFDRKKKILRIHDLKTGVTPAKFDQLIVYAALFFLEYGVNEGVTPNDVDIILRIYQNDQYFEMEPEKEDIMYAMAVIVNWDRKINKLEEVI